MTNTQNKKAERLIKCATAGFTQSLINNGATPEYAAQVAAAYVHPQGMLAKRAAARERVLDYVVNSVIALRQG